MRNAATQVKSERKKREGAEKELRAAHEARTAAAAAAVRAQEQLQAQQGDLVRWQRLAEERAGLAVRAENAACEMRQACDKQVRVEAYRRRAVSASCLAAACIGALPAWSACSACVVWLLGAAQLAGDLVVQLVHEDGCMGALQKMVYQAVDTWHPRKHLQTHHEQAACCHRMCRAMLQGAACCGRDKHHKRGAGPGSSCVDTG